MSAKKESTSHPVVPVVTVTNNHPTTTSLNIAQVFGKSHNDVLKAIRALEIPEEFRQGNFPLTTNKVPLPKGGFRDDPIYHLTRDGFTVLVMGFTGPKAMKYKLAYIDAFNLMESELQKPVNDRAMAPVEHETEILQALLATNKTVSGLREHLGALVRVADAFEEIQAIAANMCESVSQLARISSVESAVRDHVDHFRKEFRESREREYQRNTNANLQLSRIEGNIKRLTHAVESLGQQMDTDEQSRRGLYGYLEKCLPPHEAADLRTTGNTTKENDPVAFINQCCIVDPFASVEVFFLYKLYKAWCFSRFSSPLGRGNFWEAIQDNLPSGVSSEIRSSKRFLTGLKPASGKLDIA